MIQLFQDLPRRPVLGDPADVGRPLGIAQRHNFQRRAPKGRLEVHPQQFAQIGKTFQAPGRIAALVRWHRPR
jgi:hypothetical protein